MSLPRVVPGAERELGTMEQVISRPQTSRHGGTVINRATTTEEGQRQYHTWVW